ncbi:nucleolar complex protein 3 [Chironomus tepperi]|uniref:nucleolar complex protein 3 n=1 Tax=Chironomus tepperi TaxID=113505 RepID=UPI00391EF816
MPIRKNIKISSAKRGHHERGKKNFLKSKKQLNREKQIKSNIFKKSNNEKRNETLQKDNKVKKKKSKSEKKENVLEPAMRGKDIKASDIYDMLSNESDNDSIDDQIPIKRQKIEHSDEEMSDSSFDDEEEEEEDLSDGELEKIEIEQQTTSRNQAKSSKNVKELLPIKTKSGLMPRTEIATPQIDSKVSSGVNDIVKDVVPIKQNQKTEQQQKTGKKILSAMELIQERERELENQKFRIGKLCSGITENPEDKIGNLKILLQLLPDVGADQKRNLLSVRKITMFSLAEIFKDIIPDYKIGIVDLENQKVKKDTLARVTYENELLKYYKKFLRELETILKALKPGKFSKRPSKESINIAESAVFCLCEILQAHPYFNFNTNIAQLLVIYLNCSNSKCRKLINETFIKIFKTDKRLDLTLHIVRNINHLVKKKSNSVYSEVVACLLALQIKNINVDAEKEAELKQKKMEQHRSRLLSLSKRERKRKKKLSELDKELMETQAEENKQTKNTKLTDISKLVFTIYFRILKESPKSRILNYTLEGLAKFAHIINIEFFSDLINVLNSLIESADLGYREQLFCIQTVFAILSGQGEALNIDPARFYTHLYRNVLRVNAGRNHEDIESVIETLENILIKRRKNITHLRYIAFLKRLMTLSLQILHNGALGCLAMIKNAMQLNSSLDVLLDTESQIGSGKFNPFIDEPEYSNSNCTSFFELYLLRHHYHPTVVKMANHISKGCPLNQTLDPEISKMTPINFYNKFDSNQMAFNPPIPCPPKDTKPKFSNVENHVYKLKDLNELCYSNLKFSAEEHNSHLKFNFFTEFK